MNVCDRSPLKVSDKLKTLEARKAVAADDEMVVHDHIERFAEADDLRRQLNIGVRRGWIAGWMIVDENECRRIERQGAAHDLARIDGRMVDRTGALNLVGDQNISLVEK